MIINMQVQQAQPTMTRGAETEPKILNVQVILVSASNSGVDVMSNLGFTMHDPASFDLFRAGAAVTVTLEPAAP